MANTVFLNWINRKSAHAQTNSKGKTFYNVSIPSDRGITGFATVAVNAGQILACTKKDGTAVDEYCNILLGNAEKSHKVSYCVKAATKKKPAVYETIEMTNADIVTMVEAARKAYKASQKAVETETEQG